MRRESYHAAFDDFDPQKIAEYDEAKRAALLQDKGIIRNRLKVNAFIENAKATLIVQEKYGSLDAYLWGYTGNQRLTEATHDESVKASKVMSKGLKKDGFRFTGPTTCYAFMQASGMINDHTPDCFRYIKLREAQGAK
jgi:DNA-3-methyladenine glycosylase I